MIFPSDKPSCGTPQIIVAGTGYGECILVHLGNNKYVMIDSFINPDTKNPVAIDYLEKIGLSIGNIIGIICSHWDDDHIRGVSEVASKLKGINVGIPVIFTERELDKIREYLGYTEASSDEVRMNEFTKLLELNDEDAIELRHCVPQRQLFSQEIGNKEVIVETLSPSDKQYRNFINQLVMPKEGDSMQSIDFTNNSISVVSIIKFRDKCCLFGGDLENGHNEWNGIINNYNHPKAEIFKIPHHGSENGFSKDVWKQIVDNPISVITRFNRGKVRLPQDEQVEIIRGKSRKVFVVGGVNKPMKGSMNKILEGFDTQQPRQIVMKKEKLGMVRLTYNSSDWKIETYGEVEEIN